MWALLRRRECYCVMCPHIYKERIYRWEKLEFLSDSSLEYCTDFEVQYAYSRSS